MSTRLIYPLTEETGLVHVGWRLAEEVAWARPARPGPEWWTLMDIAQDARDDTRQSMCGMDHLTARAKRSKRTVFRYLDALRAAGLLTVARKSAPGIRAIYEIPVIHTLPPTGDNVSGTRSGDMNADTRTGDNGCQAPGPTGDKIRPTGDSVRGTHAVTAPSTTPSPLKPPVSHLQVEGCRLSTGEPAGTQRMSAIEKAAWQAAESRRIRETKGTPT